MSSDANRSFDTEPQGSENDRQGFALAGALLALVIVGALVTGSFFAASQEQAIGLSARYNDAALYVAEYGLNKTVASVPKATLDTLTGTMSLKYAIGSGNLDTAFVWVQPFGNVRLIVSKGVTHRGDSRFTGGTRVLGMFVRTFTLAFNDHTAMTIQRGLVVKGSAQVSGQDTFPPDTQWSHCSNLGLENSVVAPDTSQVSGQKGNSIIGPLAQDTSIHPGSFNNFGDVSYNSLAAMANITYNGDWHPSPSPNGTATTCVLSDIQNWGEPASTVQGCMQYFPIIHVIGNLHVTGNGRGQGILLVDGYIDIQGAFQFWGITITKRYFSTAGNGGHINGTLMAADSVNLDNNVSTGNSVVELSSCAIRRAAAAAGTNQAMPLRNHSWIDLTGAGAGF